MVETAVVVGATLIIIALIIRNVILTGDRLAVDKLEREDYAEVRRTLVEFEARLIENEDVTRNINNRLEMGKMR